MMFDIHGVPVTIDWESDGGDGYNIDVYVGGVCISDWMDHFYELDKEIVKIVRDAEHNKAVDALEQNEI